MLFFFLLLAVIYIYLALNKRISRLEEMLGARKKADIESEEATAPVPSPKPPTPRPVPQAVTAETARVTGEESLLDELVGESDFESVLGGNWLVKIGVLALLVGTGFFFKYVFDNWIGPVGQILLGLLLASVLLGLGEYWHKKYAKYAQILSGGGMAVFYLTFFAAQFFYGLISPYQMFFMHILVTVAAGMLAVYYNAGSIATLGIIGGFAAPFMLGIENIGQNEMLLLTYLILLNLGILGISFYKNWRTLSLLGFVFTYLSFGAWYGQRYTPDRLIFTESVATVFFLLFAGITVAYHIVNRKRANEFDLALILANAFVYFGISYGLLNELYSHWMGFFAVSLSLFYFLLAYGAYLRNRADPYLTLALAGISVLFLTLAVPLQLDQHWITLAWAAEAVVLAWIGLELRSVHTRLFALGIFVLVAARLLFFDIQIGTVTAFVPLINKRFFVFAVATAAFYAGFTLWKRAGAQLSEEEKELVIPGLLLATNIVILFFFTSEIGRYFQHKSFQYSRVELERSIYEVEHFQTRYQGINQLGFAKNLTVSLFWTLYSFGLVILGNAKRSRVLKTGGLVLFGFTIVKLLVVDIIGSRDLTLAQNFTLSFVWTLVAISGIALGIYNKFAQLRVASLILLWLMILKVFLFDTWNLRELYRIGAYFTLGIILLITGYIYVSHQERIKQFLNKETNLA